MNYGAVAGKDWILRKEDRNKCPVSVRLCVYAGIP